MLAGHVCTLLSADRLFDSLSLFFNGSFSAIRHTRKRLHNKCTSVCIIYSVGSSRVRIAIITVVQHGISSDGSNFGPIGYGEADNCCAEPDGGQRDDGRRNCGIQYTTVSCFSHFYGWSLAYKSVPRTFSGCSRRQRERARMEKRRDGVGTRRGLERRMD